MTRFASDPIYLLIEFPRHDSVPMRTQQMAHKKWLEPLVVNHGGKVRMALKADQLHGFGLDLEPPLHYYSVQELDTEALERQYRDYKAEQKARAQAGNPFPKDSPMMQQSRAIEIELIERGYDLDKLERFR
jgi:hypothetical protein